MRTGVENLRVLHVGKYYPPFPGGMETHLRAICRGLKRFLEVSVIVSNDNPVTSHEEMDGVPVTRVGRLFQTRAAPVCPQMARLIRDSKADIVHVHLPNPTALIAYWASGNKGRLVITYHSDVLRQRFLSKAFQPMLQQALHRATAVISASPNYIEHSPVLRQWRGRCRVIPFGIDTDLFESCKQADVVHIRSLFGPRLVLAVGRLVYYKGFEYLLKALKDVDAHLLIIGDGPLKKKLETEANVAGIGKRMTILTAIDDVRPYYRAADVFVLPSIARTEAFGIVQLEAMASGKPVVNTDLDSGVPFVSIDGLTGLTVPPKNASALAGALNTLLNNPSLAARYGAAGKQRVIEEFGLEKMVSRTLDLYNRIAHISSPGSSADSDSPANYAREPSFSHRSA